ncbi:uncharacterized protein TM35_000152020 [Trypanosoma theileri]|uniref:Uncharacterized protein n=1 Tax=Trypanosoma theileri TaxID=67003 RepID=A0A1X0NVY3_9TRYP|nr:uncharacterized protein TM35_000152020 [Trypanosoma theileri]ORC88771.1 hypothetical protein TM35_000152020 [Trypanosoma theileri]
MFTRSSGTEQTPSGVLTRHSSRDIKSPSWELLRSDDFSSSPTVDTNSETRWVLDITDLQLPKRKYPEDILSTSPGPSPPQTLVDYLLQGIPAAAAVHKSRDFTGRNNFTLEGKVNEELWSLLLPPEPIVHPATHHMQTVSGFSTGEDSKEINTPLQQQQQEDEEEGKERIAAVPLLRRNDRRMTP